VIDTFMNSRLSMVASRVNTAPEPKSRLGFKTPGMGHLNSQDAAKPNKGYRTPNFAKPSTSVGEGRLPRGWTCGSPNHKAADHGTERSRTIPRALFEKGGNKQNHSSSTSGTPKSVPAQAKINHASVSIQCDVPSLAVNCLPHARLAVSIPKLTFPPPEVYKEVNNVAKEIAEREAKLLSFTSFDAVDMSGNGNLVGENSVKVTENSRLQNLLQQNQQNVSQDSSVTL